MISKGTGYVGVKYDTFKFCVHTQARINLSLSLSLSHIIFTHMCAHVYMFFSRNLSLYSIDSGVDDKSKESINKNI